MVITKRRLMELSRHKYQEISYFAGGEGELMMLLHGIPGSSFAWKNAGRHLAEKYQVVIPDQN
jgi:pimeloyl-ACP methyl ester carboxylesterase